MHNYQMNHTDAFTDVGTGECASGGEKLPTEMTGAWVPLEECKNRCRARGCAAISWVPCDWLNLNKCKYDCGNECMTVACHIHYEPTENIASEMRPHPMRSRTACSGHTGCGANIRGDKPEENENQRHRRCYHYKG